MRQESIDKLNKTAENYYDLTRKIRDEFRELPKGEYTLKYSWGGWNYTKLTIDNDIKLELCQSQSNSKRKIMPCPFNLSTFNILKEFDENLPTIIEEFESRLQ